jgi:hypothetical protein
MNEIKTQDSIWEAVRTYLDDNYWPCRGSKPRVSTPLWCKEHQYAWQYEVDDTSKMHVYGDFPSLGLKKKECPICQEKVIKVIHDEDEY